MDFLLVTFCAVGHVNPSLQFAKRLVSAGMHVTLLTSHSALPNLAKTLKPDGLTVATFSDGYDDGFKPGGDPGHYMSEIKRCCSQAITDLVVAREEEGRPFTCLIYTLLLPWAGEVARGLHLRSVLLWIQPATLFDIYYHNFNGYADAIKKLGNDPSCSIKLPGLPPLTINDFPSFFHPSNKFPSVLPMYQKHMELLKDETNTRVLVNTFDALEPDPLSALEGKIKLIGVGPLVPMDYSSTGSTDTDPVDEWLNSKPEASVIYVSYGSISELPKRQLEEIARGLLDSGHPFLWVVRSSRNGEDELSRREELEKCGMIVPWCDQMKVLSHPSVGCFVTHCGWNSSSESLLAGVPVVASPQWADQKTNAKLIEDVWRTGLRMAANGDGIVEGGEMRKQLEVVMGEEGEEMRKNARKWKKLAMEAMKEGGSSHENLRAFVQDFQ